MIQLSCQHAVTWQPFANIGLAKLVHSVQSLISGNGESGEEWGFCTNLAPLRCNIKKPLSAFMSQSVQYYVT